MQPSCQPFTHGTLCSRDLVDFTPEIVIVVTDRVVLDQQLQDTIYQFEHKRGVVRKIDDSSRQLAEALEHAVPIVITTLQKFPFVSRQLLKMAKERGTEATGTASASRSDGRAGHDAMPGSRQRSGGSGTPTSASTEPARSGGSSRGTASLGVSVHVQWLLEGRGLS